LWRPAGGAYNVDSVLSVMVSGLEEELKARMNGTKVTSSSGNSSDRAPSGINESAMMSTTTSTKKSNGTIAPVPVRQQGADVFAAARRVARWLRR
jgi:hypothetical protein